VLQPEKLRTPESVAALRAFAPELAVVAAYGKILSGEVLRLPARGCINVHASLLPRYRGAAPIQWAILRGETVTGVTIMQMDEGMDTGPMLLQRSLGIRPGETYGELQERLAHLGAAALAEALDAMLRDDLHPQAQDEALATMAPKIDKELGSIDWQRAAEEIEHQVRAFNPWPSAFTAWQGEILKVHRATVVPGGGPVGEAGCVVAVKPDLVIACGGGTRLRLDEVQQSGKQRLPGAAFARGARLAAGGRLG
jgi:methionyl-tRNA formyltransferase